MAGKKISELNILNILGGTEEFPLSKESKNYKVNFNKIKKDIFDFVKSDFSYSFEGKGDGPDVESIVQINGLESNHTYRIHLYTDYWDTSSIAQDKSIFKVSLYNKDGSLNKVLFDVLNNQKEFMPDEFEFEFVSNYVQISGMANVGVIVRFSIEDVTEANVNVSARNYTLSKRLNPTAASLPFAVEEVTDYRFGITKLVKVDKSSVIQYKAGKDESTEVVLQEYDIDKNPIRGKNYTFKPDAGQEYMSITLGDTTEYIRATFYLRGSRNAYIKAADGSFLWQSKELSLQEISEMIKDINVVQKGGISIEGVMSQKAVSDFYGNEITLGVGYVDGSPEEAIEIYPSETPDASFWNVVFPDSEINFYRVRGNNTDRIIGTCKQFVGKSKADRTFSFVSLKCLVLNTTNWTFYLKQYNEPLTADEIYAFGAREHSKTICPWGC